MKRILLAAGAVLLIAAGPSPDAPFRVAVIGGEGACAVPGAAAPAGERAYAEHLQARLGREVRLCRYPDTAAAARALAAGEVDLAPLDPVAYAPVADKVRPVMTVREKGALTRVPAILAVKAGAPQRALEDMRGSRLVFGGRMTAALDLPKHTLAQHGAGDGFFAAEAVAADEATALADLRAGRADGAVLHAGAWRRQCRGDSPADQPCKDLAVIWMARPRADLAMATRGDITDPERFRLVGVHVSMHLEAPEAFTWATQGFTPAAESFEPSEAGALSLAQMQ
ncbi:MAG: PhnD/SsuA/transferrin family substrate-binding protein [Phenylobacterium sp.]|jgi:ABC-type phosphate/phosphonate transport system substrate-binding protein|uniref:PhnD/SsuA/transferrin family substrate-binding protein n=1 Tax=Phenylobacterium sp. TaxID=1871053 RepID=UPI002A3694AD|nr:PhnD/SsuA/transferrin family substrate-binding protein [Phenylobacterium sp.]MDX9998111.1 PhnD/SsuA/transferrin family substrate-binding protein [Phenylobacterium sp.]